MSKIKSLFIVFEGIDGSGKTTQIKKLYQKLKEIKFPIHLTCEPTNEYIGKIIREIFLKKYQVNQHTITALFLADRLEHILNPHHGILKQLESDTSVLCDRYYFSSYAYHSIYVEKNWILECNKKCKEFLQPDLTIFFDVSVEKSLKRIQKRNKDIELYETKENLKKARENYLFFFKLLKNQENNILFIDADRSEEEVFLDLWNKVKLFFT